MIMIEKETVTIIYQVVGYTTKLLSQKQVGNIFRILLVLLKPQLKKHKVVGIGGGVGCAFISSNSPTS